MSQSNQTTDNYDNGDTIRCARCAELACECECEHLSACCEAEMVDDFCTKCGDTSDTLGFAEPEV